MSRISVLPFLAAVLLPLVAACTNEQAPPPTDSGAADAVEQFNQFSSDSKGYSISYPEGWSVQEDAASLGDVSGDAFSAPAEDAGTPNVNVLCSPIPKGTTTADLYAVLGTDVEVVGQVSLEGVSLDIVDTNSRDEVLDYAQVAVAEGECSWVITLTTSEGSRSEYLDVFIQMAESFQPK
jgi:hypothetical protein